MVNFVQNLLGWEVVHSLVQVVGQTFALAKVSLRLLGKSGSDH